MLQKTHWTDTVLLKVAFPLILERIQPMQHHKIRKVKSYTVFPKVEGISGSGGNRTKTIYSLRARACVCVFLSQGFTHGRHMWKNNAEQTTSHGGATRRKSLLQKRRRNTAEADARLRKSPNTQKKKKK